VKARARIIALILTAQTVANLGPLGIPAIASLIQADLGLTLAQAGSFLSAYYIGPALVSLPAGTLADRWGVKRMLVLGQIVIAVGLLAASTATSYVPFALLLIAAGFGYGMLNPTSTKAVMGWAPRSCQPWRSRSAGARRWSSPRSSSRSEPSPASSSTAIRPTPCSRPWSRARGAPSPPC
jgi:MFS family permease